MVRYGNDVGDNTKENSECGSCHHRRHVGKKSSCS